jgi:hypothetical protein
MLCSGVCQQLREASEEFPSGPPLPFLSERDLAPGILAIFSHTLCPRLILVKGKHTVSAAMGSARMPEKREVTVACTQLSCSWDTDDNLVRPTPTSTLQN